VEVDAVPLVTLLTDFGLTDSYVGELKAALLGGEAGLRWVDLSHNVSPGDVREAAWLLLHAWDLFPAGTVHLAVVDPGVGGRRRPLAARAGGHFFVGPDNGLLAPALQAAGSELEIREISYRELERPRRGTTFDGRDVFAPVAAKVAAGVPLHQVGPEAGGLTQLEPFAPAPREGGWEVEVVRVDRFGNLVTVASEAFLRREFGQRWRDVSVRVGTHEVRGVRIAYEEVPAGDLLLTIGSAETLEVSCNRGCALDVTGCVSGDKVTLRAPAEDGGAQAEGGR
jgi:S-adenosylmethionine hydrolase